MSVKANPVYRAAVVKTIDELFFEKRNHKRSHTKIFRRCIYPLYGICESTSQNYRKLSDEKAAACKLPDELRHMFRNYILLARHMQPIEVAKALSDYYDENIRAIKCAKQVGRSINAETLREFRLAARDEASAGTK